MLRQVQNDRPCQVRLSASEAAAAGLAAPPHQAGVRGQDLSRKVQLNRKAREARKGTLYIHDGGKKGTKKGTGHL
jgi:hypothetical protein